MTENTQMKRDRCPCGKDMFEIMPFIWCCTNSKWPHAWKGQPEILMSGLSGETVKLAIELLRIRLAHYPATVAGE